MAYNPITGSDDYFDPNDPNVISGSDAAVDVMSTAPQTPVAPAFTGYTTSQLGGRQDSQKDASKGIDYASMMNAQAGLSLMYGANPLLSGAYGRASTYGKRGLGMYDPIIQNQANVLNKDYNSPWGVLTKGVTGLLMGRDVGSLKDEAEKKMMSQQNAIASIYGSDASPFEKARALISSGDPTAAKLASAILREEQMNRTQANQDRNYDFKQDVNQDKQGDIAALAEQAARSGYLDLRGMYGKGAAVKAYLQQKYPDFDVNGAIFKTEAVRKQIQSLNGPQQTRLNQAISSVQQSIPEMAKLNQEFTRSGIIPINKIILGIRKNEDGTIASDLKLNTQGMTPDQVQIAQKFITQMSIMRDETAQVFSGGYAPTEAAFHLADQVLNPFLGPKITQAGLEQLGVNLDIRRKALSDVQSVMPSEFGAATQSPEIQTGTQRFVVNGRTYNIPSDKVEAFKKAKGLK